MAYQGDQFVPVSRVITDDYTLEQNDHYIGVNCNRPITIILPDSFADDTEIVIKLEMRPPLNGRIVVLTTQDYSSIDTTSIDGQSMYVLNRSYQSVTIVSRGGHWFII